MVMFLFGAGFGMIFGAVVCGIGAADHAQEDYMRGYKDRDAELKEGKERD